MTDRLPSWIRQTIPWGALGISLVFHMTGLGIGAAIVFTTPPCETLPQIELSTTQDESEPAPRPLIVSQLEWHPTPAGGSSSPLEAAEPTELTLSSQEFSNAATLDFPSESWNWTETIGEAGIGVGSGSGDGGGTGDGFFGLDITGDRIVFVVDASRSMNTPYPGDAKNRLGRVKIELFHAVRRMASNQRFFVVFFNTEPIPMPAREMISPDPVLSKPYMEWIFKHKAQGQTNPESALLLALQLRPDKIHFLTDGDFSYRAVRSVREANRGRIPIHTVGFGGNEGESHLQEIARDSRGTYKFIPAPEVPSEPNSKPTVKTAGNAPKAAASLAKPKQ